MNFDRAISIVTYNRANRLPLLIESVLKTKPNDARLFVCDDGSTDDTAAVAAQFPITFVRGPNLGVGANKNRALFLMQNALFMAIVEDDLMPMERGWFEIYESAALTLGIHHFCRVQEKEIPETNPEFTEWCLSKKVTPIYGSSPRGDLTFITRKVVRDVGALNPQFLGVGGAHGEWSNRVAKAGLIPHPLLWVDIKEARDKFVQAGDTEGGRWLRARADVKQEIKRNVALAKQLRKTNYIHHPLVFP